MSNDTTTEASDDDMVDVEVDVKASGRVTLRMKRSDARRISDDAEHGTPDLANYTDDWDTVLNGIEFEVDGAYCSDVEGERNERASNTPQEPVR